MTDSTPPAPAPPNAAGGAAAGSSGAPRSRWSLGELLDWTQVRFAELGIEQPRLDAERLLARAIGCNRITLYTDRDRLVDDDARARFRELVRRRLAREPVAYIEGTRGFHALGLELTVDARVLVPRPETEHLVDWLLEDTQGREHAAILDVGTGSGAIALAVKHGRAHFDVTACDVSPDALAVARDNGTRLGLTIHWVDADLLQGVPRPPDGWVAIAANLPYIATDMIAGLAPEVARHEPRLALDGGPDGLRVVEALLDQIVETDALAPDGAVYLEIGFDQAERTAAMLRARGLAAATRNDYDGIARIVRGRRPPA